MESTGLSASLLNLQERHFKRKSSTRGLLFDQYEIGTNERQA
jgi:hypothetical protein